MNKETILNIIIQGEKLDIEFKSNFNIQVIETLVAFTNTKGGKIYIGITDNRQIDNNFILNQETIPNWLNEIKTKTQPSLIPDIEIIEIENKQIVEISIKEFPIKPVSCKGKYFKRVNNSNPGKLPDTITIDNILSGDYVSEIRNLKIATLFKEIKLIEKYGSGFSRIIKAFKAYNLQIPTFENFQSGFRIIVFAKNDNASENVVENVVENRSDKIINLIKQNNQISANQIAKLFSITERTAQRDLDKLKNQNKLKRIGSDKSGYWEVIK